MPCRFRPCIDLHDGMVKQIVGASLQDDGIGLQENFVSERAPSWFSRLFRGDQLLGGHIIKLGAGNDAAARDALQGWPNGMQIGGGIGIRNAAEWLEAGASHVIVTSALFDQSGIFQKSVLEDFRREIGPEKLVLDLSCLRSKDGWVVAMNRWQTLTNLTLSYQLLDALAPYCAEFLIHAADVEGLCGGVDSELVKFLGGWGNLPMTYAGGARGMDDVREIETAGRGLVDFTIGSSLDLYGGIGITYEVLVEFMKTQKS